MSSLDRILPFLRPIEDLLRDPAITEVMVNAGGRRVFVERAGRLEAVPDRVLEVRNLTVAIKNIADALWRYAVCSGKRPGIQRPASVAGNARRSGARVLAACRTPRSIKAETTRRA